MSLKVRNSLYPSVTSMRRPHGLSMERCVDKIKADFFNKYSIHKLYNFLRQLGAS